MKGTYLDKHYSEATGKLHIPCPYRQMTAINVHVIIRDGICYRAEKCMVVKCKFNRLQSDVGHLLSLTW